MSDMHQAAQAFIHEAKTEATAVRRNTTAKAILVRSATGFRFVAEFDKGVIVRTESKQVDKTNLLTEFLYAVSLDLFDLDFEGLNAQIHIAKAKDGWLTYISIEEEEKPNNE